MVQFEKRGVPTVSFTAPGFVADFRQTAKSFGLPQLPMARTQSVFTSHSAESIGAMVEACIDQAVAGLTQEPGAATWESELTFVEDDWLTFDGEDLLDAAEHMNTRFLKYGWSDGFPLRPPTERQMELMLTGTKRDAQDQVAILEPGFGIATVEKIAANAVMAGCRPEHLPVVIAAVECIAEPKMYLRNKAMSTGPHAPLLVVNGPIRKKIGLNSGTCVLGPGAPSYANTVIGRAMRLCMMNVGHCYAGVSDMDAIGSPIKYSMCAAENEEDNPWSPYHVEHGYDADTSTVTVHFVYATCELQEGKGHEPEGLIDVFATAATNLAQMPTGLWLGGRRGDPDTGIKEKEHHFLFIGPIHAGIFARAGWTKDDVRRAMHRKARMPFHMLMRKRQEAAVRDAHPELDWLWDSPESMVPVLEDAGCYDIAVVGAPPERAVGRGAFFYGAGEPETKPIEE